MGADGTMYLWRGTWWPGKPAAIEEKDPAAKIRLLQEDIERQEVRQGKLEKTNEKLKAKNKALQAENKMLILGDMRELGKDSADEHQKIADYLEECGFKDVVLVGE